MPVGISRDASNNYCIDGSGSRYSGEATWEAEGDKRIIIHYGDSRIVVGSESRFGFADWSEVRFSECAGGRDAYLTMFMLCGQLDPDVKVRVKCDDADLDLP